MELLPVSEELFSLDLISYNLNIWSWLSLLLQAISTVVIVMFSFAAIGSLLMYQRMEMVKQKQNKNS